MSAAPLRSPATARPLPFGGQRAVRWAHPSLFSCASGLVDAVVRGARAFPTRALRVPSTPDIPGVSGPPYAGTIRWSVDGQFVSPTWNYTASTPTSNFTLLLEVWDANNVFLDSEQLLVQVSSFGSC